MKTSVVETELTVNEAEAQSAGQPPAPSTLIVYKPGAVLKTANEADMLPLLIAQGSGEPTAGLIASNKHDPSVVKNPTPDTEIVWPTTPDVGLSVIVGARIVKVLEITSWAPLVAVAITL